MIFGKYKMLQRIIKSCDKNRWNILWGFFLHIVKTAVIPNNTNYTFFFFFFCNNKVDKKYMYNVTEKDKYVSQ